MFVKRDGRVPTAEMARRERRPVVGIIAARLSPFEGFRRRRDEAGR
jgi:hypothetical protein